MHLVDNPEEAKMMGACGRELAEEEFGMAKLTENCFRFIRARCHRPAGLRRTPSNGEMMLPAEMSGL